MYHGLPHWFNSTIGRPAPDRAAIEQFQLNRILKTLQTAQNAPFYRERRGVFSAVTNLETFSKLPFTTEQDVLEQGHKMLAVSMSDIQRVVRIPTSGTTHQQKTYCFTQQDLSATEEFFAHGLCQLYKPGQTVMICFNGQRENSIGHLVQNSINAMGGTVLLHGFITNLQDAYQNLCKADALVGVPNQLLALGKYAKQKGFSQALSGVLVSSDNLSPALQKYLSQLFGCPVFNHYGFTEAAYGCAVDCTHLTGMHIRENEIYIEIINPITLAPLPDGEWGEVVLTSLNRTAMPLIRYRTGDISRILPGLCPCGCAFKRLDFFKGRLNAPLPSIVELDAILLPCPELADYAATLQGRQLHIHCYYFANPQPIYALEGRVKALCGQHGITPSFKLTRLEQPIMPPLYKAKRVLYQQG